MSVLGNAACAMPMKAARCHGSAVCGLDVECGRHGSYTDALLRVCARQQPLGVDVAASFLVDCSSKAALPTSRGTEGLGKRRSRVACRACRTRHARRRTSRVGLGDASCAMPLMATRLRSASGRGSGADGSRASNAIGASTALGATGHLCGGARACCPWATAARAASWRTARAGGTATLRGVGTSGASAKPVRLVGTRPWLIASGR